VNTCEQCEHFWEEKPYIGLTGCLILPVAKAPPLV